LCGCETLRLALMKEHGLWKCLRPVWWGEYSDSKLILFLHTAAWDVPVTNNLRRQADKTDRFFLYQLMVTKVSLSCLQIPSLDPTLMVQLTPIRIPKPVLIRVLILSSHLCIGLPSHQFPWGFWNIVSCPNLYPLHAPHVPLSNIAVEYLTFLLRIPETGYPDEGFSWFSSVPPGECRDSAWKFFHDHFLTNPSQFFIQLWSFYSKLCSPSY
jgi:hypothetical protein